MLRCGIASLFATVLAGIALSVQGGCRARPAPEASTIGGGASNASPRNSNAAPATSARSPADAGPRATPKLLRAEAAAALERTAAPQAPTPKTPSAQPQAKKRYRVAAMGDSLTDVKVGGGKYLAPLREHCPKSRFDAYGIGGQMVNQMRRRFDQDILRGRTGDARYTDVIIFGGVNDLYSDLTAHRTNSRIQADLQDMYRLAKGAGLRVVALTVAPWGGFKRYFNPRRSENTRLLNRWISSQRAQNLVDVVLPTTPLLSCGNPEFLCPEYEKPFRDGLHFGPKGHQVLGEALFQAAFSDCE